MGKRMTVVSHNEALYTALKVEAARRHQPASELVAEAVREFLDRSEDAEPRLPAEEPRTEWQAKGGGPWDEAANRPRMELGKALLQALEDMGEPDVPAPEDRSVARDHDKYLYTRTIHNRHLERHLI